MHEERGFMYNFNFLPKPTNCMDDSQTICSSLVNCGKFTPRSLGLVNLLYTNNGIYELGYAFFLSFSASQQLFNNCVAPFDAVCLESNGCEACGPKLHHPAEGFYYFRCENIIRIPEHLVIVHYVVNDPAAVDFRAQSRDERDRIPGPIFRNRYRSQLYRV
ncbi:hypothetical protein Cgig2_013336 [Carnegiea gigantea]|uniref:Uncharacterized protein n=1 Tax=Carnegiea gigantea TaxID=171969 RepID=A0A9Q1JGI0_9CARY|nr:hypothetical protein Cgig2_013336 [Carnegiea gigantea]